MKNRTKGNIIKGVAIGIDVLCPLAATLTQFPLWVEESAEATMSGCFLLLAAFCVLPLFKYVKAFMKSPSVPVLWWVVFILMIALSSIIDQMIVVCFVGGIANTVGAGLYKLGRHIGEKQDKDRTTQKEDT